MKQYILTFIACLLASVIAVLLGGLVVGQSANFGASGTRFPNGISADSTSPVAGEVRGTTLTITGAGTIAGLTNTGTLTQTGAFIVDAIGSGKTILTSAATTSASAANVCDSGIIEFTPTSAAATATLPTSVALQADCLDVNGSYRDVLWENTGANASTTVFVAGASTTLEYVSSSLSAVAINGGDSAILRFYSSTSTVSNSAMVKVKIIPFND